MSKNIIILFTAILLIIGGFSIYTYNQYNLIKKELEEKNLKTKSDDELISKLNQSIKEKELQVDELKVNVSKEKQDLEKEYKDNLSGLTEEKAKLEEMLQAKDYEKEGLVNELEKYTNQIKELQDELVQQKSIPEKDYSVELALLSEEKTKLADQLKISQDLLLEKENAISLFVQQKEESAKNITDQDKLIAELSKNIQGYENQITELKAQMAEVGKEKEIELTNKLAALSEEKSKLEAKLQEVIEKSKPNYYEVEKGDSLWKITKRFYVQGKEWIKIFEANLDKIKNPNLIYPYQRLTIPKE
jgi:chromosome segregation ATPase